MDTGASPKTNPTVNPTAKATPDAAPNRAHRFARVLVEELVRAGVRHACLCPGSRSTPLTVAAARNRELRCWSHIDERSAGFFALGLAKASRSPVALVCTSGTAAANFLPAVVEAHYAGVPLVVLTADRPAELREWGAGQTIDQVRIYGSHVRWFAEAAVPENDDGLLRYARALACRAVGESATGPVHLNLPFREPLAPTPEPGPAPALSALAEEGRAPAPYVDLQRADALPAAEDVARLATALRGCERGVVACGPVDRDDLADAVSDLAAALGWPVLAEPTSQLRCGPHVERAPILATGDLLLRDAAFADAHPPECVLRFGASPTSKSFRLWLERHPPRELVLVDPDGSWNDPSHLATRVLRCDPIALCDRLVRQLVPKAALEDGGAPVPSAWLRDFLEAERRATAAIETGLAADDELLEARAVREVADSLPDGALLYVSNSMPVRDLDAYLPASTRRLRVLSNRGANGIDGMVSSALGAAAAKAGPVTLLTGDLALLHDCGGLLAAHRLGVGATIVVLDNDGGGIFSFLPIAEHGASVSFEEHFRTPHGLDLGQLARGFGVQVTRATSWDHFRTALKEAQSSPRTHVVVLPVDRDRNVAQHRALQKAVSDAIAGDAS